MRILALDIGEKRCGIAVSDAEGTMSFPVTVLPADEVISCAKSFRRVLEDYEPELIVSGLPKTLSGEEGPQAQRIRDCAEQISRGCGIPVEFCDERLSSAEAKRIMRERGFDERRARGKVDEVAASLFLQTYLDSHR